MNKPNIPGITVEHSTDERGASCVSVTGVDLDLVTSAALDVKNASPVDACPEVVGPYRDIGSGSWRATVRLRKEAA
ncbi:hypothetical protein [Paraburkholderia silvatlantica]|uniref:hypothetical protein n=1 Tax=Paraburkholderia silvatlantica TaxID=321895 RepID=UPI0037505B69